MRSHIVLCIASAAVGGLFGLMASSHDATPRSMAAEPRFLPAVGPDTGSAESVLGAFRPLLPGQRTEEERVNIGVYEQVYRGVVHINTRTRQVDRFFFFETESAGVGSGSVIDRAGHILTNLHVVEDAEQIEVTLSGGNSYRATLVGHDALHDVAILKIDAPADDLYPIAFGDSSQLRVGQRIYAIGSPFELERTFTTGIVSSTDRTLPSRLRRRLMKSIIQVDAAMNPGNSGGPLVDTSARLIGMNTAIASKTGENTGVGFAIPVNRIKRIVPDLIRYGKVSRPDLGITSVRQTDRGLLIRSLTPGGPAQRAGLRGFRLVRRQQGPIVFERIDPSAADLIVAVGGQAVRTLDDLESYVEDRKPGDQIVLTVLREGRRIDVAFRLGEGGP